jgi:uncharacterized membrane protein YhaH (DUF805 family)
MLVWTWIISALPTCTQIVLMAVGDSQTGRCVDGDPIPYCPDEHGLAGIGYLLFIPTLLTALLWFLSTLALAWRRVSASKRSKQMSV